MKEILKYSIGLGIGAFLFYRAFPSVEESQANLATARWSWLLFSMCFALLSHFLRAVRWRMQLKASGYDISVPTAFSAVMMTYMVNLALPRAGEVARCTMLYQSDKVPVPVSIGTVFTERVLDVLILGILVLVSLVLANGQILDFWTEITTKKGAASEGLPLSFYLGIMGVLGLIVAFLMRKKLIELPITQKIIAFVKEMIDAALNIRKLENPLLFVFYSAAIWTCYVMMMYVGLYCFEPIAGVSGEVNLLKFAFLGTVIGSFGMAMPIPGGMGTYHNAIIFAFIAFHVFAAEKMNSDMGKTFALAFHTAQMLVVLIGGAIGYAYLITKKGKNTQEI